ncbi:hypothetical protein LRS13_01770 [Svornostia abyssi]|uniref:Secreted protein n=1 Tax=Svornostia abyssi TaxID=2898438 RepID=A0ABY5PHY4_9ACTN|nr:hypothetical protein LRS13_01770 [Parviterribacteraceae bacterium J379]
MPRPAAAPLAEVLDVVLEVLGDFVPLRLGDVAVLDLLVQACERGLLHGGLHVGEILVLRLGDLRDRLPVAELLHELGLGEPERLRGVGHQLPAAARSAGPTVAAPALAAAEDQAALGLALLDLVGLRLRDLPGLHGLVELRGLAGLQRGAQLLRGHIKLLGGGVEHGLLALLGLIGLGRGDGAGRPCGEGDEGAADDRDASGRHGVSWLWGCGSIDPSPRSVLRRP